MNKVERKCENCRMFKKLGWERFGVCHVNRYATPPYAHKIVYTRYFCEFFKEK